MLWIAQNWGTFSAFGQTDTDGFAWVKTGGGPVFDSSSVVAVDASTNVYVAGLFSSVAAFGTTNLTSAGGADIFLAKYKNSGDLQWILRAGGTLEETVGGMALDAAGNVFVSGAFKGQARFGSAVLTTRGFASSSDGFLAKYNPQGTLLWVQQGGGANDDRGFSVTIGPSGECYWVGSYQATATFGANTQITTADPQGTEGFIAKYSNAGALQWVKRLPSSRGLIAYAVAADAQGNTSIAGEFIGTAQFGTNQVISAGDRDAFILQLNGKGEPLWATHIGGSGSDGARALSLDPQGGILVGGYFSGVVPFLSTNVTSAGNRDFFLVRLLSNGTMDWARTGGGLQDEFISSIAVTARGGIYVAGTFTNAMAIDTVTVRAASNAADAFWARFSKEGTLQWVTRAGGTGTAADAGNSVAVTPTGDAYLAGDFSGNADFGSILLSTSGATNRDSFIARRAARPPVITLAPSNQVAVIGDTVTWGVLPLGDTLFTYQWYLNDTAISGATNAMYTNASVRAIDAGNYQVEVGNDEASTRTPAAVLSLLAKINLQVFGNGQVLEDPLQDTYDLGTTVQLYSQPDSDAFFYGWSGALSGSDNPASLTLNDTRTVIAIFGSRRLQLDTQGVGSITALPVKELYDRGDAVTLSAQPGKSFAFLQWSDGSTNNPRQITVDVTNHYTAVFTNLIPVETVTIGGITRIAAIGMPAMLVDGVFIPQGPIDRGDQVTLTFQTTFTSGTLAYSLDGSAPSRQYVAPVLLTRSAVVRAVAFSDDFSQSVEMDPIEIRIVPSYGLQLFTAGGGLLSVSPEQTRYLSNTLVTVTATPTNGWTFLSWNLDLQDTQTNVSFYIRENRCIEGVFGTPLVTAATGAGTIETTPALSYYPYGSIVRLTAIPSTGSNFVSWGGSAPSVVNPLNLSITRTNPTARALFLSSGSDFPVTLRIHGNGNVVVFPRLNVYTNGQSLQLIATPDPKQQFQHWGGDIQDTTNRLSIKVTQPLFIEAFFSEGAVLSFTNCFTQGLSPEQRIQVLSPMNTPLDLEISSDLTHWQPWQSTTNTYGRLWFFDPEIRQGLAAPRFYRARAF